MAPFLVILSYFAVLAWAGLRPQWKTGSKRAFWVSACFLVSAFVILTLASFNIYTPSPYKPVEWIINAIFHIE